MAFKCVALNGRRYGGVITIGKRGSKNRKAFVGNWDTAAEAGLAVDLFKVYHYGSEADTNFPMALYAKELKHRHEMTRDNLCTQLRRKGQASVGGHKKKSQYRGVSFLYDAWIAYLCEDKTTKSLGGFDSEGEAAAAHDRAAVQSRGLKAQTNFPLTDYLDLLEENDHSAARRLTKERLAREGKLDACTHDWLHHFDKIRNDPSQYHPDLPSDYSTLLSEGGTITTPAAASEAKGSRAPGRRKTQRVKTIQRALERGVETGSETESSEYITSGSSSESEDEDNSCSPHAINRKYYNTRRRHSAAEPKAAAPSAIEDSVEEPQLASSNDESACAQAAAPRVATVVPGSVVGSGAVAPVATSARARGAESACVQKRERALFTGGRKRLWPWGTIDGESAARCNLGHHSDHARTLEGSRQMVVEAAEDRPKKVAKQTELAAERSQERNTLTSPVDAPLAADEHEHAEDVIVETEPQATENAQTRKHTSRYEQKEAAARARAARLVAKKEQKAAAAKDREEADPERSITNWREWWWLGQTARDVHSNRTL